MTPRVLLAGVLVFLIVQRMVELYYARRNERWARRQGAREFGAAHYPWIVLLHAGFLFSLALEGARPGTQLAPGWPALLAALAAVQVVRYWCLIALGRYWNTKVLVIPGAPLLRRGPYRWWRHPNYAVVITELLLYPWLFQAWWTMAWVGAFNLALLYLRIKEEEKALALLREDSFAHRN